MSAILTSMTLTTVSKIVIHGNTEIKVASYIATQTALKQYESTYSTHTYS